MELRFKNWEELQRGLIGLDIVDYDVDKKEWVLKLEQEEK